MSSPTLPALVDGVVAHRRSGPVAHAFRYRIYQWLVDLDDLPRLPRPLRPFASFRSADHLGDSTSSTKANVVAFLATQGLDLGAGGRVVMLAHPRVLGYVFNPLTVFWCYDADDQLLCVVAEVHNTYGERHAYLLRPDETGTSRTAKDFYVSPFYDVSGHYELRFVLTADRVTCQVRLTHGEAVAFTATFAGRPQALSTGRLLRMLLRQPLMPQRVALLIRLHGLRLWSRRLPVQPRPTHVQQAGV